MKRNRIVVKALWLQANVGLNGAIGAILKDGTPVAVCSFEKWSMGPNDSLRSGWTGDVRIGEKVMFTDSSEEEFRNKGLGSGSLKLTVPLELQHLL